MKTPEEIKQALKLCYVETEHVSDKPWPIRACVKCPYEHLADDCNDTLAKDALATITQLEETISLMMIQMRGDCGCCKHGRDMAWCNRCLTSREDYHPLWEYEGLPEVKKDDKPM